MAYANEEVITWYALIKTGIGSYQKVYTQNTNGWAALQTFRAMYGDLLMSQSATPLPPGSSMN